MLFYYIHRKKFDGENITNLLTRVSLCYSKDNQIENSICKNGEYISFPDKSVNKNVTNTPE